MNHTATFDFPLIPNSGRLRLYQVYQVFIKLNIFQLDTDSNLDRPYVGCVVQARVEG
jgi:hypothetical protein